MNRIKQIASAAILCLCLWATAPTGLAQDTPLVSTDLLLTNSTALGGATTTMVSTNSAWIQPRSGFAVWPKFVGNSGDATGNATFAFQVSRDGINWTTTSPLSVAFAGNGTTTQSAYAAFGPSHPTAAQVVAHARYVRLASVANANNGGSNYVVTAVTITRNRD